MRQQERIVAEIIRAAGAYRWVGIYEIDHRRQRVVNLAWSGPLDRKRRVSSVAASEPQHRLLSIRPRAIRDGARLDAINRAALERVQLGGKAFLSSTLLDGRFWLRACIVNPRASRDDIDILIAAVRAAAEAETCVP